MYNRIGRGGRVVWYAALFAGWCFVTFNLMQWVIVGGVAQGADLQLWLRSNGFSPGLADLLRLFSAVIGFIIIPLSTAAAVLYVHRLVKGNTHEEQRK